GEGLSGLDVVPKRGPLELGPHVAFRGRRRMERTEIAGTGVVTDAVRCRGDGVLISGRPEGLRRVHEVARLQCVRHRDPLRPVAPEHEVRRGRAAPARVSELGDRLVEQGLYGVVHRELVVGGRRGAGRNLGVRNVPPLVGRTPHRERFPDLRDPEPSRIPGRPGVRLSLVDVHKTASVVYERPVCRVGTDVRGHGEVVAPRQLDKAVATCPTRRTHMHTIMGIWPSCNANCVACTPMKSCWREALAGWFGVELSLSPVKKLLQLAAPRSKPSETIATLVLRTICRSPRG